MTLQYSGDSFQLWPGVTRSGLATTGGSTTLDAAGEYHAIAIYAHQDMAISHVFLKLNAVSGSPTADIRIETMDASTGLPSGTLWATNTNIVTGTLTTTGAAHALTATANVSKGQWFVVKIAYNSGASLQLFSAVAMAIVQSVNYSIVNTGTPSRGVGTNVSIGIGPSATQMYHIGGGTYPLISTSGVVNVNNTNGGRIGGRFELPFKAEIHGVRTALLANDADISIYEDGGGAVSGATGSFDASAAAPSSGLPFTDVIFATPFVPTINTRYRAAIVPTTGSNVGLRSWEVTAAGLLTGCPGEGLIHRTDYTTSGGWVETAAQLPNIDLIIKRLDDGVGGGDSSPRIIVG